MTEITESGIDTSMIESGATLALILGALAVFQWSSEAVYQIGAVLFVIGIVTYIANLFISRLNWHQILERTIVVLMMTGILGMFQSWNVDFYAYGFYVVGLSTLSFIIVSHIPAPDED